MKRGDSADYALSMDEVQKVLDACKTLQDQIIAGVPIFQGLRVSELAHLKASWIHDGREIRVPSAQACRCGECLKKRGGEWRPKTRSSIRSLPIAKPIEAPLKRFLDLQQEGLQLSRVTIWDQTKDILLRAKIKVPTLASGTVYPHALRATCASILASSGMEAAALCYFMGWRSLEVAEHYVQIARSHDAATLNIKEIFG